MKTKEVKLFLFAADMIFYTENTRCALKTLLELINKCETLVYRISIQKPVVCLYTYKEQSGNQRKKLMPIIAGIRE